MERKDFRNINSREELDSVKYIRSKALKICFGGRTLILEKIYLTEGDSELVISEGTDGIKIVKSLEEAKSFIINTLNEEIQEEPKYTDLIQPKVNNDETIEIGTFKGLEYEEEEEEERELTKQEIKEARKLIKRIKREVRRAKIKKFFIILLNVIVGILLLAIAINFIIEYIIK